VQIGAEHHILVAVRIRLFQANQMRIADAFGALRGRHDCLTIVQRLPFQAVFAVSVIDFFIVGCVEVQPQISGFLGSIVIFGIILAVIRLGYRHGCLHGHAGVVLGGSLDGEGASLGVLVRVDVIPLHVSILFGAVSHCQMHGFRHRRSGPGVSGHVNRCHRLDRDARRIGFKHGLILGAGDRNHGAVTGLATIGIDGEVLLGHLVADYRPLRSVGNVGGRHGHVMVRTSVIAGLVGEQIVLVSVHIAFVGFEQRGAFACGEGATVSVGFVVADRGADFAPRAAGQCRAVVFDAGFSNGIGQGVGLLLAQGHRLFILVDAVVGVAFLLHRHINGTRSSLASPIHVNPRLRFGERDEIRRRHIHHAVVTWRGTSARIVIVVQIRGPVDHIFAQLIIPVGFRSPRVARAVVADLDMTLVRPVHQIIGFPNLDIQRTVVLCRREAALPAGDLQIGGKHVEGVAVMRAHDEWIAQSLFAFGGGEQRSAFIERIPVERVVALGSGEAYLLASHAFAGEERPNVCLIFALVGRHRRNGDREFPVCGGTVVRRRRFQCHVDGIFAGSRPIHRYFGIVLVISFGDRSVRTAIVLDGPCNGGAIVTDRRHHEIATNIVGVQDIHGIKIALDLLIVRYDVRNRNLKRPQLIVRAVELGSQSCHSIGFTDCGASNLRGSIFREPDRVVIARPNDRHTVAFRNDGEVFGCLLRNADGVERIGRRS